MSARFALRDSTRAAHDRLDSSLSGFDLADPHSYSRFLAAQARAFLPVEQALADAGADRLLPGWSAQRRSPALLADLADLGIAATLLESPPPYPDEAALAGGLYVLEGSRLGAATLLPQVPATLPRAFLSPPRPGPWRELVAALERMLHSDVMLARAVGAALATFDCFECAARKEVGGR